MKLKTLYEELEGIVQGEVEVTSLCLDSRDVTPGAIFFAIKGVENDGHRYIRTAVESGAVCVIYSEGEFGSETIMTSYESPRRNLLTKHNGVVYIKNRDVVAEVARLSDTFYGSPTRSLDVFGVTGTNGKSTTTCLIRDILGKLGKQCGYMGTIAVRYGDVDRKPTLTTPDSVEIQQIMRDMVDAGMDSVTMEVSSHGLALKRTDSVDFDAAIFTNLTWDHLDFHGTMENYFDAKKRLFSRMKPDGVAVLNADDGASIDELMEVCSCRYVTYGTSPDADYRIENLVLSGSGTTFDLVVGGVIDDAVAGAEAASLGGARYAVMTNLLAEYNIMNLVSGIAALVERGYDIEAVIEACRNLTQVDGRMEVVPNDLGIDVIVDYAHTPDGYEKLFAFVRSVRKEGKKVYAVFGSAGKRDKKKRPVMGEIAAANCDLLVLTEEDPRNETGAEIAMDIKGSLPDSKVHFVADRDAAIEYALSAAEAGDMVLILGKGDEKYMDRGHGKDFWPGDNIVAEEILKKLK